MFDHTRALSKKADELKPSGIRKFFDLLSGREGVISLTVGQPDFATPKIFMTAAPGTSVMQELTALQTGTPSTHQTEAPLR